MRCMFETIERFLKITDLQIRRGCLNPRDCYMKLLLERHSRRMALDKSSLCVTSNSLIFVIFLEG